MFNSNYDENYLPGTWILYFQGPKKILTAHFTCPKCERTLSLKGHKINNDGSVIPIVDCPYLNCDFSDDIKLIDWDPEAWEPEDGSF